MSSSGEEEETGPSVDSNDPEERIAARRLRIARRVEAAKRAALGEDPNEKKEVKEELSKSRKQIEESRQRLTKLQYDGTELVTNIRVAGDAREASRRIDEEETRRQRKEKLEAEAKAGSEKFEEITKKWESALQKEIPQDLHEMLMHQKAACDAMIEEKNKLITDFQLELKQKDDQYVKDLKKQAEDIDLMIERMQEQIKNLTKANRQELNQIEKSFATERSELLDLNKKKWEQMMQSRGDKEVDFMKAREKRVEDYEQQLQHLRVQDAEEYNMVKIKLETDVQILEQQLQQMRATYQLNLEKLEYNFQVLKKRDEENTITKSQQKRKITRLQDVLTNLKIKLNKQEKNYRDENSQLTEDYKRITEQFRELQKKSKHFMATDYKKFHDVWVMNEEEAKVLVKKVMEEDRIICEQQLGLNWDSPDLAFLENVGPVVSEKTKRKAMSAQEVVQEVISATSGENIEDKVESLKSVLLARLSPQTVKQILELLGEESGFLIESKLNTLLAPLDKDEQSLMKLDAIFTALGIDTEEDIHLLSGYFLLHVDKEAQQVPSAKQSAEVVGPEPKLKDDSLVEIGEPAVSASDSKQVALSKSAGHDQVEMDEDIDKEIENVTGKDGSNLTTPRSDISAAAPDDFIHPNDVLKALKAFVDDNKQSPKDKNKYAQFKITSLDERDDSDDSMYWLKHAHCLSDKRERVWEALLDALEKYSEVLTGRGTLITETDSLRQQNAELRMLLHQYVNSKVNQELEIPPTRVLQLELNQ